MAMWDILRLRRGKGKGEEKNDRAIDKIADDICRNLRGLGLYVESKKYGSGFCEIVASSSRRMIHRPRWEGGVWNSAATRRQIRSHHARVRGNKLLEGRVRPSGGGRGFSGLARAPRSFRTTKGQRPVPSIERRSEVVGAHPRIMHSEFDWNITHDEDPEPISNRGLRLRTKRAAIARQAKGPIEDGERTQEERHGALYRCGEAYRQREAEAGRIDRALASSGARRLGGTELPDLVRKQLTLEALMREFAYDPSKVTRRLRNCEVDAEGPGLLPQHRSVRPIKPRRSNAVTRPPYFSPPEQAQPDVSKTVPVQNGSSTATKLLRSGHSRRSVSTGDPGGLIEGFRRHGPPQARLTWLPEQSTAARACAPSCSSMKSPASYRGLMAKRACLAATLWPLPRPWKRERRRRGGKGSVSAKSPQRCS